MKPRVHVITLAVEDLERSLAFYRGLGLESEGIIVSRPYQERPRRLAYELTQDGRDLAGALRALAQWGARHSPGDEGPRHAACGTPLELRWWCPSCGDAVDPDDDAQADGLRFV